MLFTVSGDGAVEPSHATFTVPGLPATAHASQALTLPVIGIDNQVAFHIHLIQRRGRRDLNETRKGFSAVGRFRNKKTDAARRPRQSSRRERHVDRLRSIRSYPLAII